MSLPQLTADRPFLTDGGLETTLVFHQGLDLPDFAAFPLLDSDDGRAGLIAYYTPYLDLAERLGTGFVLDTPTWRANLDWGARLGYDAVGLAAVNHRAVEFVTSLAAQRPSVTAIVNGVIGPRGDGYVVGSTMSAAEAAAYHGLQARAFAEAGAEMISAITMTYADEAIGVARAAAAVGLPAVISFTVETDGRLPSGQTLGDAIALVDDACQRRPRLLHGQLRPPDALLERARDRRTLAGAGPRCAGQRIAPRATPSSTRPPSWIVATSTSSARCTPPWARGSTCGWWADAAAPTTSTSPRSPTRSTAPQWTDEPAPRFSRNFSHPHGGPVMTTTLLTRHRLWVDDRGDGPPVLLIAGLGDPAEAWTFQQEELSSRYRTIAFDNRGVGRSPLPDTPLTVAGMADDAATILDELGIDRADIVGFSGGSVTAQELAIRHPERVKSLVLMGTFGKGDRYFDAVVRMFTWMMDQAPDPHAFLEAFYLWIYTVQAHESGFVDQLIEEALAFPHQQSLDSMHQQLDAWANHTTLDRLGQVTAPTLVIAGGKDLVCPPHLGKAVADAIPGAQFEVWPEAAHQPFQEEPARFNARLEAFWTSLQRV